MEKLRQQIEQRLSAVTGDACFYYENLATGVCFGHAADKPVVAASVINLFDREASSRGIENYITAREAGLLLKRLYDGEAVSGPASEDMLSILKDQRLNGKIPFLLPHSVKIAHKTGEDDGITHDVGIVYARQPFIVCFCGEHVSPPEFERAMQDITLMLYENAERIR